MLNNVKGSSEDFDFIRLRDDLGLPNGVERVPGFGRSQ